MILHGRYKEYVIYRAGDFRAHCLFWIVSPPPILSSLIMDHTSLPQQDSSFAEWLSTNFPEADAPLSDFDFTSLENFDFQWPEQPSFPHVTEENTTL